MSSHPLPFSMREIAELEAENRELRLKYAKAIELLAQYRQHESTPVFSKRSLLARYLEIHREEPTKASPKIEPWTQSSDATADVSPVRNWRDRLVSIDKRIGMDEEQRDILELARSLNSDRRYCF